MGCLWAGGIGLFLAAQFRRGELGRVTGRVGSSASICHISTGVCNRSCVRRGSIRNRGINRIGRIRSRAAILGQKGVGADISDYIRTRTVKQDARLKGHEQARAFSQQGLMTIICFLAGHDVLLGFAVAAREHLSDNNLKMLKIFLIA